MTKYTGIRFKTLALTLLAENPVMTSSGGSACIVEDAELGQFRLSMALANYSLRCDGVLPLGDLRSIQAALQRNQLTLGQAWSRHVAATPAYNERYNKIGRDMSADYNARTEKAKAAGNLSREETSRLWRKAELDWEPAFAALRSERRASLAPAEPGPASFDFHYTSYFTDLNQRVDTAAGLTQQQEHALYAAPAAWYELWNAYAAANTRTEAQRMVLRAFRSSAELGARLTPDDLRKNAFLRLPSPTLVFRDRDVAKALKFQNQMAYARAPFATRVLHERPEVWDEDSDAIEACQQRV